MRVDVSLFFYYFGEQSALDRKKPFLLQPGSVFTRHQQRQTHPQGHSDHNFKQDAPETPHIDRPGSSVVVHDFVVEVFLVLAAVLVDDIVEYFWRHVLGSRHGELR